MGSESLITYQASSTKHHYGNLHSAIALVHVGGKGLLIVMLSEPAGGAKDLCFVNRRSFAAAQDDKPERDFRVAVLVTRAIVLYNHHTQLYQQSEQLAFGACPLRLVQASFRMWLRQTQGRQPSGTSHSSASWHCRFMSSTKRT